MAAVAVLSARYLQVQLAEAYALLPIGADREPRMHEFILTLKPEDFELLDSVGLRQTDTAPRIGKLFLDFGFHAPTVAWPEPLGLMIEPTESESKEELDRFCDALIAIHGEIEEVSKGVVALSTSVLRHAPHTAEAAVSDGSLTPSVAVDQLLDRLGS